MQALSNIFLKVYHNREWSRSPGNFLSSVICEDSYILFRLPVMQLRAQMVVLPSPRLV